LAALSPHLYWPQRASADVVLFDIAAAFRRGKARDLVPAFTRRGLRRAFHRHNSYDGHRWRCGVHRDRSCRAAGEDRDDLPHQLKVMEAGRAGIKKYRGAFVICITTRSTPWLGVAKGLRPAANGRKRHGVLLRQRALSFFLGRRVHVFRSRTWTAFVLGVTATAGAADSLLDRCRHSAA